LFVIAPGLIRTVLLDDAGNFENGESHAGLLSPRVSGDALESAISLPAVRGLAGAGSGG